MRRSSFIGLVGIALGLCLGCGDDTDTFPADPPEGSGGAGGIGSGGAGGTGGVGGGTLLGGDCDPLVPTHCGSPFPSNVYLAADPSTVTGGRVAFGPTTLPMLNGEHIDPAHWAVNDGFSAGQAPLTHMPGATVTGLPTQDTIELSISLDSPTILLDTSTGELVPHFSELDMSGADDADRALMIRPVVRLKDATRYVVAIRDVVDAGGSPIAPSPVFQALRDGAEHDDPSVDRRRALYDEIFTHLAAAGVPKDGLQIAWDYTTASRENNTRWLVHMRDDALATVGEEGPPYVVDSIEENPNQHLRRRIRGRFTAPLYLDQPGPGGRLVLGDDGLPKQNGTAEFEFVVHVPHSATTGTPGALLQNGHGLLGTKNEGQNGYLAAIANKKNFVAFSVDLVGMADEDEGIVIEAIANDAGLFRPFIDRQHQGILNSLLAMRMMKGRFWKDQSVQFAGKSAIDPSECYYRGDSQGGIFGTTYMALTTDVTRGLLGEPGMPYNLLLNRSVDFDPFFELLLVKYPSSRDQQIVLGLIQMLWDRTEPSGYAPYITENMLPGTPAHDVLIHVAIGDHQVTPLGAHIIARAVNAKNLSPVNRSVWGLEEASGPFTGSGMVEFSFGLPELPKTNTPTTEPSEDDPHDKVRVLDAAHDQTDLFLRQGVIEATCQGACDPE